MDLTSEYISLREAAEYLGVTERTVYYHVYAGRLVRYKRLGRVYLLRSEVERLGEPRRVD